MLEAAKHLLTPSKRSDVPPFIVMDVMAAAAQLEAKGARVVHMEVGQPAAPAPATAIAAAQAALGAGRIGYTETLGIPVCAPASPAITRDSLRPRARPGARGGDHRFLGRFHSGVSCAVRAGRPGGAGQSRLSALPAYS